MHNVVVLEDVLTNMLDGDYDSDDDFGGYFDDSGDGGKGSGEQEGSGGGEGDSDADSEGGEGDGDADSEGGDGQDSSGSAAGIPEHRRQKGCTTDMCQDTRIQLAAVHQWSPVSLHCTRI